MATTTEEASRPERRRRNRRPKACRLCRTRKVRCDYQQPCGTCVRRKHEHLCSYDRQASHVHKESHDVVESANSRRGSATSLHSYIPAPETCVDGALAPSGLSSNRLLAVLDHIAANAKTSCETDAVTGQTTFVGCRAPASIFRTFLSYLPDHTLPASVETIFGLTNRTISQPFVSLWNTTARVTKGDILGSLPAAETCLRYYRAYQQIAEPFFPVLHNAKPFESDLCRVLDRIVTGGETEKSSSYSKHLAADLPSAELAGYALLFAVLSSGCQCCVVAENDHQLALSCRVFVACSSECLRLANSYVNPSSETIQASLILQSVTCNDGNPGVAMAMLGTTARQAQGLGMHTTSECAYSSQECVCGRSEQHLWRTVLILDSRLSMHYDRGPVSLVSESLSNLQSLTCASSVGFWDFMFNLHCLQIQWQSLGSHTTSTPMQGDIIDSYLRHIAQLGDTARSAKSSLSCADSVQAILEQLVFTIHLDFFEGLLHCHAAVATTYSTENRISHFHGMASKFCSVISAYLRLRQLSPIAKLAWEISRDVKTSAILLAAFEVVLQHSLSGCVLHQLAQALSDSSSLRDWRDDALRTSCRAGAETLMALLRLQSSEVNSECRSVRR